MVATNIIAGVISLFFGSIGDIISRAVWYNCSVNKIWTLFFVFPPLSIITSIMYFTNQIKSGVSCEKLFDWFLIIIPIVTIIIAAILPQLMEQYNDNGIQQLLYTVVLATIHITLFACARIYKYYMACDIPATDGTIAKDKPWGKFLGYGFIDGLGTVLGIMAFNWIASTNILHNIPVLGIGFRAWTSLGNKLPGVQFAIPFTLAHFMFNASENSTDFVTSICA